MIKEYFANYLLHMANVTIDLSTNVVEVHENQAEPWRITLVDTGEDTLSGGRIKRALKYIGNEPFCMTYGDGVSDVDITAGTFGEACVAEQVKYSLAQNRRALARFEKDSVSG